MTRALREQNQARAAARAPVQPGDRIALYVPSLRGGGAERVMLNLARTMVARDLRVDLVLPQAEGPYLGDVPDAVRVVDLKAARVLKSLSPLARYLRRECPRGLISAMSHANLVAIWARALARTPTAVVVSEHTSPPGPRNMRHKISSGIFNTLRHYAYRSAAVVAVSEGVARHVAARARIEPEDVAVIYNPIVTPEITSRAREEVAHPWFAPGAPAVILSVGRLTGAKDFSSLLKAFAKVTRTRDSRLMILGEGEERLQLEALARDLGIAERVALPGFVANPFAYMARCGAFVLSSRWEGLPSALIEALACGCPVVSTDCESGPREILEHGRWGRLVPVGDADAIARAVIDTLDAPPPPAPPAALARFTPERVADQYLSRLSS